MCQSNSSKKSNIIFAIILLVIIGVSILITFLAIKNHNEKRNETAKKETQEEKIEPFLTFKSVLEENPLDVFESYPINPITINYENKVTISGLKNKEIEEKVNNILSELDSSKDKYGNHSCSTNFNVSNVLSISCRNKSKNIDLTTGNEIILEELFNKGTDIQNIMIKTAYNNFCEYNVCDYDIDYDYDNPVENEISNILHMIKKGNYTFAINYTSANFMELNKDDYDYLYLDYADFYNEITIYSRFLTSEEIYDSKVTSYCNPKNCYYNTIEEENKNESYHDISEFINDTNYIEINVNNMTGYDAEDNEKKEQKLEMEPIAEKIKEELISKYKLKESNNYRYIDIIVNIYSNDDETNQVIYRIEDRELNKKEFILTLLSSSLAKPIKETTTNKVNMLLDKENKITYLKEDPNQRFTNFEEKAYEYIMEKVNEPDNYDFYQYRACEFAKDYEECEKNKDYHILIKEATYAIDEKNKRILIYHYIPGIGIPESYVCSFIPFSIFEEQETISQTD